MSDRPNNTKPFISLEDVSLRLYDRVLFKGTHWPILSDQHWAVIGANGSGKSTLMRALCGHVPVVTGRIAYHFLEDGASKAPSRASVRPQDHIAYVSFGDQKTALGGYGPFYQARWNSGVGDSRACVSEYLSQLYIKRTNPYEIVEKSPDPVAFAARRRQVVELLGIEELLAKGVEQLSDGERRKASLARALIQDPQLLILDNPLTGLDEHFRAKLKAIIKRLMQDTMRIVVVTTREDEIPPDVTHVLLVENNQVVDQGPREAILKGQAARRMIDRDPPKAPESSFPTTQAPQKGKPTPQVLVHMAYVNVSYGDAQILQDVNWTVRRGEHWALLGPNGAGKTTLLSLILGDHPQAYANEIALFNKRRGSGESIWDVKRHIGWVAPELHLYYPPGVSCLHVVCSGFFDSVGLYRRCSSQQREIARQWMEHLGISKYAVVAFQKLSEGEQRLVLLARALVKRPQLLVLDEPCQGLDARNRERVLQIVDGVGSRLDTSVVYVTHNPDELPRIITHVMRLDQGQVIEKTRLERLKLIPATAST